jgi:hypothetical protein
LPFHWSILFVTALINHPILQLIITWNYGCGGVATAISGPSPELEKSISDWVQPICKLYLASGQPEIVAICDTNSTSHSAPMADVGS